MAEPSKQICVSILMRRTGDKFAVTVARSEKLGQAPLVENQLAGESAHADDVLLAILGPYLSEILKEFR